MDYSVKFYNSQAKSVVFELTPVYGFGQYDWNLGRSIARNTPKMHLVDAKSLRVEVELQGAEPGPVIEATQKWFSSELAQLNQLREDLKTLGLPNTPTVVGLT